MRSWRRAFLLLIVAIISFINGCYSARFERIAFRTEYIPQEIPDNMPDWWRTNLSQYLRLSYIDMKDQSAFGAIGGDVFSPNLYTTYAVVNILDSFSYPIEDSNSIVKWIKSLQDKDGTYYDRGILASHVSLIEQTYWAISILKKLKSSSSNSQATIQFLKDYELPNGLFKFSDYEGKNNIETLISQTYFAISILRLLNVSLDKASKMFNLKILSKMLQSYIASNISSNPSLINEESGYLISAIYELSYISKDLVSKEAYSWLLSKVREVDTLPYDFQYVALINNLFEAMSVLGITPKDVSSINTYLKQKVLPNQNVNGGFGFGKDNSNFVEPMTTYEVVKLFKTSGLNSYPRLDKLIESLKAHRIKNGWVKFFIFEPSVEATYYAVLLAKENGDITNYPVDKLIKYLTNVIGEVEKSLAVNRSSNGIRVVDFSKVVEQLKTLYYATKTYILLKNRLPVRLMNHLIDTAKTVANDLSIPIGNGSESELFESVKALSYFISIFNTIQLWPSDSFGLLDKIRDVSKRLAYSVKHKGTFDIRMLHDFFILNSVLELYNYKYPESRENFRIIEDALFTLYTGNGFKRLQQVDIPDVDSTYLGLWLFGNTSANIQKLNFDKIIEFVMASQLEYGFNYVPQSATSVSDLRVTYEALWSLSYLTTGWKLNYSFSG